MTWTEPASWTGELCPDLTMNKKYYWTSFVDAQYALAIFGAYVGLHLNRRMGIDPDVLVTTKAVSLRYACILLAILLPASPFGFVSSSNSYWYYNIVGTAIPWAGIGFGVFWAAPIFYKEFKGPKPEA